LPKEKTDVRVLKILVMGLVLAGLLRGGDSFAAAGADATQTVSGGGVTAKVTYLNPKSSDEPRFRIALDTHSVDLDAYDLKIITVLRDDAGKSYSPTGVESKGSGHHRESTVRFQKLDPEMKHVELVIKDVGGIKERVFRWNLEQQGGK
jgi:hypothetical protein